MVVEHGSPERFMCNSASLRRSEDEIGPRNCGRIHTARSRGAGAVVVEHGSPKRFTCNSASLRRSEDEIGPRNCGRVHTAPSRERRCDGTLPARTSHVQQLLSPTIRSREGTSEMPIGPHLRPPKCVAAGMAHCSAHDSRETAVAPETRGCDRAVELLMCPRWTFPRAWAQWWNTAPTDVHTKHLAPKTRSSREPLMHSHRARLRHGRGQERFRPQTFHVKQTLAPRPRGCDRAGALLMRPNAGRREHRRGAVLSGEIQAK